MTALDTPNDIDEAEQISRSLGEKTEVVTNTSFSDSGKDFLSRSTTTSTQEIGRRLMTAREIAEMPEDEEIIFVAGHPPIKAGKIRYFKDRKFKGRVMAAPRVSDVCKGGPGGLEAVRVALRGVEAAGPAAIPTAAAVVFVPHEVEPDKTYNLPACTISAPAPQYDEQKKPDETPPEWARNLMTERAEQKKPEDSDDGTGGVPL